MPSTKIFLTGHRGFIGAALKEKLAAAYPGELVAFDSDLRDAGQIQAELAGLECDRALVLHFATVNRRDCSTYEGHAANCAMLANLLYWQLTCEMFCTPEEW